MADKSFKFSYKFSEQEIKSGKIEGVAYSGDAILDSYWGQIVFDIDSITSNPQTPILLHHDPMQIVGYGALEKSDSLKITGQLVSTNEAEYVKKLSSEGFQWLMSVHIEPKEILELNPKEVKKINGRDVTGPAVIFMGGMIREVSFTPTPVDMNTPASAFSFSESIKKQIGDFKMSCNCQDPTIKAAAAPAADEMQAQIDKLIAENEALKTELQGIKDAEVAQEAQAKMSAIKSEFSVDGDELKALSEMTDAQISLFRKTFSIKKEINPKLTESDLNKKAMSFSSVNKNSPTELQAAAEKLSAEQKITYIEALNIILK